MSTSEAEQCPTCCEWVPPGGLRAHRQRAHGERLTAEERPPEDSECACGCGFRLGPQFPTPAVPTIRFASERCYQQNKEAREAALLSLAQLKALSSKLQVLATQLLVGARGSW